MGLKLNNESSEIDSELMLWSGRSIIVIIIVNLAMRGVKVLAFSKNVF